MTIHSSVQSRAIETSMEKQEKISERTLRMWPLQITRIDRGNRERNMELLRELRTCLKDGKGHLNKHVLSSIPKSIPASRRKTSTSEFQYTRIVK